MPIKLENRDLYPKNWKTEIVPMVRSRSGNVCEGSPAYPDCRAVNGAPHPVTGSKVVLTTAHLDHDPSNCRLDNLKHWCQRCHITYDAPRKARDAKARRYERAAIGTLL